jgi:amidase
VAGYPHLTVPMGMVEGLPIGLSFMGTAWSETNLLKLGQGFEMARGEFQ